MRTTPRRFLKIGALACALLLPAHRPAATAQVPDAPSASSPGESAGRPGGSGPGSGSMGAASPAPRQSQPQQSTFLGKEIPVFDPGSELVTWDGRSWNVANNRVFEARFEKYLNAPEATSAEDKQYQAIMSAILDRLAPNALTNSSVDEAFRLLPRASSFEIDARLCSSIADAVYSAWRAQDASARLAQANASLEQERKVNEWNAKVAAEGSRTDAPPKNKEAVAEWMREQQLRRDMRMQPYTTRLAEILATIKANQAKKELSELQAKIEFQALLVQLFLQRRFQHVLIGTRFYRAIFTGGETDLKVGKDTKDLFSKSTGLPPTVGTLDSMANEAIRDVREGVRAHEFLLSRDELESATKRLAEAFSLGEYLPEIRTLPREKKRRALEFTQKSRQLVSALEVKDYTLAEGLVQELKTTAKDFDTSKATGAIETARQISAFHLAKARNAAVSGDSATLEAELQAATLIWPRNPALKEVSGLIFNQADVQQKALVDLDQLLSQRNYRQIYDDKLRFIAASAMYPQKQETLKKVLDQMQVIETAIIQSGEIAKRGDYPGAWETLEKAFQQFPDDTKLNQLRANLTTQAADFVRTLRRAEQLESRDQVGSSLAWYLKAQKLYPASEFAQEGVVRLVKKVLPGSES